MAGKPHILMLVSNDLATDARVYRHAKALSENGFEISLWGRIKNDTQALNPKWQQFKIRRFRISPMRGPFFYAFLNLRFFFSGLSYSFDILCANDTDTLLAAYLLVRLKNKKLVYDAHEYFTEVPEILNKPWVKRVWRAVENLAIPSTSLAYSVCEPIANRLSKELGTSFHVIRNIAEEVPTPHAALKIELPEKFLIYQGVLNLGRGIELMIDAMPYIPVFHLVICGAGDIEQQLKNQAERSPASERIHFMGRIEPSLLAGITKRADLGFSLEEDLGYNYRNALPNKIFSYLQAEIPSICSKLPVMADLVSKFPIGLVLQERSPEALAKTVTKTIEANQQGVFNYKLAKEELSWDKESNHLISLYKSLL